VNSRDFFSLDYTAFMNLIFILMSGLFLYSHWKNADNGQGGDTALSEKILFGLACTAYGWLAAGVLMSAFGSG